MNLFSTFDPSTGYLSMNWMSMFTLMIAFPMKLWMKNGSNSTISISIMIKLHKEMKQISNNKGFSLIFNSLFMMILMNNMMGLIPYIFTASAQMSFSLPIALSLWMASMIMGWTKKTNKMFAHMVPMGTPKILMPLMIIIESISNIMRPGSLSVRLTANMIAGHLIMSLLGNSVSNFKTMLMIIIIMMMLMMFELAVSMIQSYVFMTLSSLYSSEI
uniref:ATP synthase subunit a n=1 Tax=Cicadellidae gen. sp. 1 JCX-2018 TaxID=2306300 RepID=A0A346RNJ0_9HEMI|nr:ATP synthase F0 subunit 6 [Cicadellidae gen. sp. 1 JCX-2018]